MGFTIFQKLIPNRFLLENLTGKRSYSDNPNDLSASHKVNALEKRFFVWTGKYKSIDLVPPFVSQSLMESVRNRMRIRIANYMMAATALGCLLMVYLGKQDAKAGKSLQKQNMDWHKQIKEQHEKEQASTLTTKT